MDQINKKPSALWQHDEDLLCHEIQERLRMANRLDWDPALPNPEWFEQWTNQLMDRISTLSSANPSTEASPMTHPNQGQVRPPSS